MIENATKAKAITRMNIRHAAGEVSKKVSKVPAAVQKMHTPRFMPENALASRTASPIGENPPG